MKAEVLRYPNALARLRRLGDRPELAKRFGFLTPMVPLAGRGSALPEEQAFSLLCRVEQNARDVWPDAKTALEQCMRLTEVGEKTLLLARYANKHFPGYVPTSELQLARGRVPLEDQTSKFSFEHLLVLVLFVNCNQRYGTPRSMTDLAAEMQTLPPKGSEIPKLKAYSDAPKTPVKYREAPFRDVAISSPGPIAQCTAEHVRTAIDVIRRSEIIDADISVNKRSAAEATDQTQSNEEKAAERCRYQSQFFYLTQLARPFDDDAKATHPPQSAFQANAKFDLTPWMCDVRRKPVWIDESWTNLNDQADEFLIDKLGDEVSQASGGERYVLVVGVDEDGVYGWQEEDYGKINRLFWLEPGDKDTMINIHKKVFKDAVKTEEDIYLEGRDVYNSDQSPTWMGGGVGMFPSRLSVKEASGEAEQTSDSYKMTMNGQRKLRYLRFLCDAADEPIVFILDAAPYNMYTDDEGEFNPHRSGTTLGDCEAFLKSEHDEYKKMKKKGAVPPMVALYLEHWTPAGKRRGTGALKESLIDRLKEMIPKPALTTLQIRVAEWGIRKIGYPHIILYLPVRMPEWDPVEFVFAQIKKYFRLHRELRFDVAGFPATMGVDGYRQLLLRMWARLERVRIQDCVRHVLGIYETEWTTGWGDAAQPKRLQTALQALLQDYETDVSLATRAKLKFLFPVAGERVDVRDTHDHTRSGHTPTRRGWAPDDARRQRASSNNSEPSDDSSYSGRVVAARGSADASSGKGNVKNRGKKRPRR